MDGLDVIRELRQWEKEHRPALRQHVVGISAHASDSDADRGILLGMNAYQRKPLKLEDLRNIANSEDAATMSKLLDDTLCERCRMAESINPGPKESCLVATDSSTQEIVITTLQENGWVPATASSKHELLDKLRSRNWEAVVLDSDFLTSVQEFREWEMHNRIHRQRNCFVLSSSSFKPTSSAQSLVNNLPQGIDGVLSKPATSEEMKKMLSMARSHNPLSFTADDIVTR